MEPGGGAAGGAEGARHERGQRGGYTGLLSLSTQEFIITNLTTIAINAYKNISLILNVTVYQISIE